MRWARSEAWSSAGGIPPGIEMDAGIGAGQVKPRPTRQTPGYPSERRLPTRQNAGSPSIAARPTPNPPPKPPREMTFRSGREVSSMDQRALLHKLVKDLDSCSVDTAFPVLDQMLALQGGDVSQSELQSAYVDGLLKLIDRNPAVDKLAEIDARLRQTPAYSESEARVAQHAEALVRLTGKRPNFAEAMATATAVADLKGYGSSLALQKAHAQALFETSQVPGARPLQAAETIATIPSYRDSEEIQLASARALCNATAQGSNLKDIDRAVSMLEQLPLRKSFSPLEESLERAVRNRSRYLELRSEAKKQGPPKAALAFAGAILLAAVVAVPVMMHGKSEEVAVAATPLPSATGPSAPERDLAEYLEKSQAAMTAGDMDQATTYGLMSLRLAESLGKTGARDTSLDVLASAYTRLGQDQQAKGYFEQISQIALGPFAQSHLETLRKGFDAKQPKVVEGEGRVLVRLVELQKSKPDPATLEQFATALQDCNLRSEASLMWEKQGDLGKAAENAEKAGEPERALALLKKLAEANPAEKGRLFDFRMRCGVELRKDAEAALTDKNLESAQKSAESALSLLDSVPKAGEEKARCLTVQAKVAYMQERFPEAARLAIQAKSVSPNADRKARAEAYALKDAELITADELKVETFVFPPPRKSSKFYTYAYYFGAPGNYVSGGEEQLFESPQAELSARLSYSKPEQGVTINLRTETGGYYNFSFDAGRDRVLKPGTYENATRSPFNYQNPGLDFSGGGRGCNTTNGRFVVHECAITANNQVERFAADFISECDSSGGPAVFGKVRYNSHYE